MDGKLFAGAPNSICSGQCSSSVPLSHNNFLPHLVRQISCMLINVKFKMLKFKIAPGLLRIIRIINHLCREAVNGWVLQDAFCSTHLACCSWWTPGRRRSTWTTLSHLLVHAHLYGSELSFVSTLCLCICDLWRCHTSFKNGETFWVMHGEEEKFLFRFFSVLLRWDKND